MKERSLREEIDSPSNKLNFIKITNTRIPVDNVLRYELNRNQNRDDDRHYLLTIRSRNLLDPTKTSDRDFYFKREQKEFALAAVKNLDEYFGVADFNHPDNKYL